MLSALSYSLLSAHVSSLYNTSRIQAIPIITNKRDLELANPEENAELFLQHASYASYYNSPQQPSLLLRLVNNNYTIQLTSVSAHIPPIAFTFPSPVLPNPFIVADQYSEAHVIVCTAAGSVYRLMLPVPGFWTSVSVSSQVTWCKEHIIKNPTGLTSVHVSDPGLVLLGMKDGNVLKLQASRRPGDTRFEDWSESVMSPPSVMSLPAIFGGARQPGSADIIGFASDTSRASAEVAFTISRDRQLRAWKDKCIGSIQVPATHAAALGNSSSRAAPLLPESRGTLLRVLPPIESERDEYDPDSRSRIVVFMPSPPTEQMGGYILVYRLSARWSNGARQMELMTVQSCSTRSAGSELRDFVVIDEVVWCLWDTHGRVEVESAQLATGEEEEGQENPQWTSASPPAEPDYSPGYFEELLSENGSLTDAFMGAILRPGVFSRLTLETALHEYRMALADHTNNHAGVLTASYPTLTEHITALVGSSVNVAIDPQTGEQLWEQYWSALKRDWEGFVARCKEIERSARWPVALGVGEGGQTMVLERERLGIVVTDDGPIQVYKTTVSEAPPSIANEGFLLFEIAWALRQNIPGPERNVLESKLTEVSREMVAFAYMDIAADIARTCLTPHLSPNVHSWVTARLNSTADVGLALDQALVIVLDLLAEIKGETEEPDMMDRRSSSTTLALRHTDSWDDAQWPKAFTTAYISSTVTARVELCRSLLILCVFLVDGMPEPLDKNPTLITRVFEAFRVLSLLHHITLQPADHLDAESAPSVDTDDISTKMQGLRMGSVAPFSAAIKINYSLLHSILPRPRHGSTPGFTTAEDAHRFLRASDLLTPFSQRSSLEAEVKLLNELREANHLNLVREIAGWLPLAPAVAYVLARTWLDSGRPDDAADLFERVARNFGDDEHELIDDEDADALVTVLPFEDHHLFVYYRHVADLFAAQSLDAFVITFGKLAVSVSSQEHLTQDLWDMVFKAYVALGLYEEAYSIIVSITDSTLHKGFIRHLISVMCDRAEVDRLTRLNFVGFQIEVEQTLSFKARNSDPVGWPNYSKVLYSWHIFRGDYRSAGEAMFKQARRLNEIQCRPDEYIDFATEEAQCYLAAINCLSLIDPKSAWVALPGSPDSRKLTRKRPKPVSVIPDEEFEQDVGNDVEVVELADMRQEYMLVLSRLSLAQRYPQHDLANLVISPTNVVSRWLQAGNFDEAISNARSLNVSMTPVFESLALRCVYLSKATNLTDDAAPWLLTDRTQSWGGSLPQRAWRYLQEALDRNDGVETDYQYRKVVLAKILEEDRTTRLPAWLVMFFEDKLPEHLVRTCLRYNLLAEALRHSIRLVHETRSRPRRMTREPFRTPNAASLPYSLFDQVLVAAKDTTAKEVPALDQELRKELAAWKTNATKYTENIRPRPYMF